MAFYFNHSEMANVLRIAMNSFIFTFMKKYALHCRNAWLRANNSEFRVNSIAGKLASGAHVRVRDRRVGSRHSDERKLFFFLMSREGGSRTLFDSVLLF